MSNERYQWLQHGKCSETKEPFSLKLLSLKVRSVINLLRLSQPFSSRAMFPLPLCNTYVTVMCDHMTWTVVFPLILVFYEMFRKVSPQFNTVVHVVQ